MQKYIILSLLTFNFLLGHEANHIIFTQITITPDEAEVIAIHNPTNDIIDLSDYYLSDAITTGKYYYNLPAGNNYWSGSSSDFIARFPDIDINPGQTLTISIEDASIFNSYYTYDPDLTLTDDMLDVVDGQSTIGPSASLADNYESLVLFYWDGSSSIVQDVDYFYWGISGGLDLHGIDKTGVPGYLNDTPITTQSNYILEEIPDEGFSYVRKSTNENGESGPSNNITGNGITGHDETSEVFNQSWEIIENPLLPEPIVGCTDNEACNYDENAEEDDGSCDYSCFGCMDPTAINFVPTATIDNGACNISGDSIEYIVEQNEGSECDEDLSVSYQIVGLVVAYDDKTSTGGPQIIVLQDDNGDQMEAVVWNWDVPSSSIGFMVDPYDPSDYVMHVEGTLGTYLCSWQFEIADPNDILLYDIYHPQGDLIEDQTIIKAEIVTAPYVIIPTLGERLDFHYSFPSNSRVIIRILDLNGLFITSLVDRYYETGGTVVRYEEFSDWDGRDHLGQIVSPGTYLIHIEASDFQSGRTTVDVAPIVVGAHQ